MDIFDAIRAFDDRSGQFIYIVPVTYGYIFTLSGDMIHFYLAVAAFVTSKLTRETMDHIRKKGRSVFDGNTRRRHAATYILASFFWLVLYVCANVVVFRHFKSADLVIVALGVGYAGVAVYATILLALELRG